MWVEGNGTARRQRARGLGRDACGQGGGEDCCPIVAHLFFFGIWLVGFLCTWDLPVMGVVNSGGMEFRAVMLVMSLLVVLMSEVPG